MQSDHIATDELAAKQDHTIFLMLEPLHPNNLQDCQPHQNRRNVSHASNLQKIISYLTKLRAHFQRTHRGIFNKDVIRGPSLSGYSFRVRWVSNLTHKLRRALQNLSIQLLLTFLCQLFALGRVILFKILAHRKSVEASVYRRGPPKGERILFTRDALCR